MTEKMYIVARISISDVRHAFLVCQGELRLLQIILLSGIRNIEHQHFESIFMFKIPSKKTWTNYPVFPLSIVIEINVDTALHIKTKLNDS